MFSPPIVAASILDRTTRGDDATFDHLTEVDVGRELAENDPIKRCVGVAIVDDLNEARITKLDQVDLKVGNLRGRFGDCDCGGHSGGPLGHRQR